MNQIPMHPKKAIRVNQIRPMAVAGLLMATLATPLHAQYVFSQLSQPPQQAEASSHSQRCLAALRLASEAAECGMLDVSIEAVRRVVGDGPPVEAVKLGSLLGGGQQASSVRIVNNNQPDVSQENTLARRLAALDKTWHDSKADAELCYAVWLDAIFPPSRPAEAFPYGIASENNGSSYSLNLSATQPQPLAESGCRSLVLWAKEAGQVADLKKQLDARAEMPAAKPVVDLVRLILSTEDDTIDRESVCETIADQTQMLVSGRHSHQHAYFVAKFLEDLPEGSPARHRLFDGLGLAISGHPQWSSNQWLRYMIATETNVAVKQGSFDRFEKLFGTMQSVLDPIRSGNEDYVQDAISRGYGDAANTAFKEKHLALGLRCLKLQLDAGAGNVGVSQVPSSLLDINENTFRELLVLPRQTRYDTLSELVWSMPMLGLSAAGAYTPTEVFPQRFVENYKAYRKKTQLPIEAACDLGSLSFSVLEWVMRDAIELGKTDEITARIEALKKAGSDDAKLAEIVFAKAQGQTVDIGPLLRPDTKGAEKLRPEVEAVRGALTPLDLDIIHAAISNPDTYAAGLDLAERFAGRAKASYTNNIVHGRRMLALAKLKGDSPPKTNDVLKHFVVADDYRARATHQGQPRESLWLKNENGNWEHHASAARSMLLLKYPLAGDFKISFECNDDTYAESATTAFGIHIDIRGYLHDLAVEYIGERDKQEVKTDAVQRGEKNAVDLQHSGEKGTLTVWVNGKQVGVFNTAEATFPFVGPQSMMHRQMFLENYKIEGQPVIPRAVDLLSPSLIGWSNLFHSRRLPQAVDVRVQEAGDDAAEANTTAAGQTSPETDQAPKKSVVVNYDWQFVGGELQTIDHVKLFATDEEAGVKSTKRYQRPGEEWIYYVRPLCEGETVEFEFYQETGAYSLQPTIDRIAVQLGEQLREHWIVSDPNLFGIASTNRRDLPTDQVLGEVKLREKQWNKAAMKRNGDFITLSINGSEVYRQKVDPVYGGRFGFMGVPESFQVKVRSVSLRGDWPEKLPEDLFEEL